MGIKYKNLFSPYRLGPVMLKNKIIMSPMDTSLCDANGDPTKALLAYYERRARGEVGMIITEFTSIDAPAGLGGVIQLRINNKQAIPMFQEITDTVHAYGTKILCQLHHAGNRSVKMPGVQMVGPIDIPESGVKGLIKEEIDELVEKFKVAALNAQKANFDGVEVHAGHGYLIGQFLSPISNTRTDEYGGNTENRSRFLIEIIRAIRAACGPKFLISVRLAVKDWAPAGGMELSEGVEVAKMIDGEDVNLINLTTGLKYRWIGASETSERPDGNRLDLAKAVKPHVKTPVAIVGKIRTGEMMEDIVTSGIADLVVVGRQFICDPDWTTKMKYGKEDEIRKCLNCLEGCYGAISAMRGVRCALNPTAGYEATYDDANLPPVLTPQKILVVGGGITGMQAAITAASRGNEVTLLEKKDHLGGQMNLAKVPPHKEMIGEAIKYFEGELKRKGVKVELSADTSAKAIADRKADRVILAYGSKSFFPPLPGLDRALDCWDVLAASDKPKGKKVTIIGGGNVGCETALTLMQDNEITILEMLPALSQNQEASHRARDLYEMERAGVDAKTSVSVKSVDDSGVHYTDSDGKDCYVEDDILIAATGQVPAGDGLYEELMDLGVCAVKAGDAIQMGNLRVNVKSGFMAGMLN